MPFNLAFGTSPQLQHRPATNLTDSAIQKSIEQFQKQAKNNDIFNKGIKEGEKRARREQSAAVNDLHMEGAREGRKELKNGR